MFIFELFKIVDYSLADDEGGVSSYSSSLSRRSWLNLRARFLSLFVISIIFFNSSTWSSNSLILSSLGSFTGLTFGS